MPSVEKRTWNGSTKTQRPQILLVDDEPQILDSLGDLLEDDFVVHLASEAREALKILENNAIAVLVTDQRMPGTAGDELLARAAEFSLATRVLLTGYSDLDSVVRAVNRGHIYAYISKPCDPVELQLTLARAAEHHDLVKKYEHERLLLEQLLENIPDAIFFKDLTYRFIRVNKAKARLLGCEDPEEVVGRGDWDFFPAAEALRIEAEDRAVTEKGASLIDSVEVYTPPDGRPRWFSTTKVPSPTGIIGVSRDITSRKMAEQQIDSMTHQLMAAEIEKKAFCREVVLAVTRGKFHLVDYDQIPPLPESCDAFPLSKPENYAKMRERLRELGRTGNLSEEATEDLVLAAGEAATNVIKHAGDGTWQASESPDGPLVRISDRGGGIRSSDLPRVLFQNGFSTEISLGAGYTLILSLADVIWLATGPEGTVIQILKRPEIPEETDLDEILARFS